MALEMTKLLVLLVKISLIMLNNDNGRLEEYFDVLGQYFFTEDIYHSRTTLRHESLCIVVTIVFKIN